jgi:hypothetical protein
VKQSGEARKATAPFLYLLTNWFRVQVLYGSPAKSSEFANEFFTTTKGKVVPDGTT